MIPLILVLLWCFIPCHLAHASQAQAPAAPQLGLNLTSQEQDWLHQHPKLSYCFSPVWKPYDHFEQGEHQGIFRDYLNLFAQKLGVQFVPVPTVVPDNIGQGWQQALDFAKDRKCDFISGAVQIPERESYLNFTAPYFSITQVVIALPNKHFISNLKVIHDQPIGVPPQSAIAQMLQRDFPDMPIVAVETSAAADALDNGKIYAYVTPLEHAIGWLNARVHNYKIIAKLDYPYPIAVATRKDWPILRDIMNKAVAALKPADHNAILQQWTKYTITEQIDYSRLWQLIAVALLIIGIIIYWNRLLAREIIQRKLIEEKLRKLARAVEQSHNTIVITDLKAAIEFVNPAFTRNTGYTKAEALGQNPRILQSGYQDPIFYLLMWNTLSRGEVWEGELLNKRKDGTLYWEYATISPIKDAAGHTTHYVAVKENITQRKDAELALQKSQEQYQRLIDDIGPHFVIYSHRNDGVVEYVSNGVTSVFGLSISEILGHLWMDLVAWQPDSLKRGLEVTSRFITEELDDADLEMVFMHPDGQLRTVSVTVHAVRNSNGKYTHSEGIIEDITRRKHAELALRLSEQRFREIFDYLPVAYQSLNQQGCFLEVNQALCNLLHYRTMDLIGKSFGELWTPATKQRFPAIFNEFCQSGNTRGELELVRGDGVVTTVLLQGLIQYNERGAFIRTHCVLLDISDRKQMEIALRDSETRHNSLIAAMAEGLIMENQDGEITTCNAAAERILGLTPAQMMGRTSVDPRWLAIHEDGTDFPGATHPISIALRTGQSVRNVVMGVHKPSGELTWILVNAEPMLQPNQPTPYAAVVTFTDITETRNARQEAEERRRLLQAVLDNIPAGVQMFALTGNSTLSNRYAEQLLGQPVVADAEIGSLNQIYSVFIADTDMPYPLAEMPLVRGLQGEASMVENMELHRPDGSRILLQVIGAPICDDNGQIYASVVIFQDITARKIAEKALHAARKAAEAASQAKSAFLAHTSHELRTPLTGILGFAELLIKDQQLSRIQRDHLKIIQRSGEHLLSLINEILDLARIESGRLDLNPAPVHLPSLLGEVVAMIRIRAETKGLSLCLEWHELPDNIQVDAMRLSQILLNLFGNAIKFTQHGVIKFWVRPRSQNHWLGQHKQVQMDFVILDTGPGIPAERLERVMLPFERLPNEHVEGAGLGLSISKALVAKMGGQLHLGSQTVSGQWEATTSELPPISGPVDHGTMAWFSLLIPLGQSTATHAEALGASVKIVGTAPEVLIVDDVADNRLLLIELLQPLGIRASEAGDGVTALAAIRTKRPDLLITDWRMPGLDGIELVRLIRADPDLKGLFTIITSASVTQDIQHQAALVGSNAFLAKPIKIADLYTVLQSLPGLNWVCDDASPNIAPAVTELPPLHWPNAAVLELAQQLTSAGDIIGLQEFYQRMEQDFPVFSARVRDYVEQFQLNELAEFLDSAEPQ